MRSHRLAVSVTLVLVTAALGISGNIAAGILPESWKGYSWWAWPATGALVVGLLVHEFWKHRSESSAEDADLAEEERHARALQLDPGRPSADRAEIWATNRGTHLIQDIAITAVSDNDDPVIVPLPVIDKNKVSEFSLTYLNDWFIAKLDRLSPSRGYMVASAKLCAGDFTKIKFDVAWIDHGGKMRKSWGIVDLAAQEGAVPLEPRREWRGRPAKEVSRWRRMIPWPHR